MIENKRIAKNTLLLYFQMTLVMLVGLYTSRVILRVLGASDYGLYNVVGGVVTMFAFLNGSLSAGTTRFIAYELGRKDVEQLKKVFNVTFVSHLVVSFIAFLLAETIGLWFLNTQMSFPADRTFAVNVVYQFSIFSLILLLTQTPFDADIMAHEKMNVYAYVSVIGAGLKLLMVLLLVLNSTLDNLVLYSILTFLTGMITLIVTRSYCYKHFEESGWQFCRDIKLYREILSFSGWNIIGGTTMIFQGQGVNILLNIFFGPVVNAARAISYQLQGIFSQLSNNFMSAVTPQITKSYAVKEYRDMLYLMTESSKMSFFLLLVFLLPMMFKINYVLKLWLSNVPEQADTFAVLVLATLLVRATSTSVVMGIRATGNIKRLNLYANSLGLLSILLIFILFKMSFPAITAFWMLLAFAIITNIAELIVLKIELPIFQIYNYLVSVFGRCFFICLIAVPLNYLLFSVCRDSLGYFLLYYSAAVLINGLVVFYGGYNKTFREKIFAAVGGKIKNYL